jgi:hypothetical protein
MSILQPPSLLNMGAPGSGKTTSLASFLKNKVETFVISTEPGGIESLIDEVDRKGYDISLLHWSYIPPSSPGWKALREAGTLANVMSYKDLSDLKMGVAKSEMKQLSKFFDACENFHDDRTGKDFGPIEKLGPERAISLDSLSGLNHICLQNTVGFKPGPHQGEWGIAMGLEENILLKWSADLMSYFVCNCHLDRVPDEITGTSRIVPAALGSKLGPRIPRFFGEAVLSIRGKDRFTWRTMDTGADLKNRILPVGQELEPDFTPLVVAYRKRVELARSSAA